MQEIQLEEQAHKYFIVRDFLDLFKSDRYGTLADMLKDWPEETRDLYSQLWALIDVPAVLR